MIFQNWGNSSKWEALRKRPNFVSLESFFWNSWGWLLASAFTFIERNLYSMKGFPPRPMRSCEKIAAPPYCRKMIKAMISIKGREIAKKINARQKSTSLLIFLAQSEFNLSLFSIIFQFKALWHPFLPEWVFILSVAKNRNNFWFMNKNAKPNSVF